VIPLPDGRILVFGVPEDPAARSDGAIAVARLLANGEPDAAFGPGGHLDLRLGGEASTVPTDALLLPDGRILVAGYFGGDGQGPWPDDQRRSAAPGWLVRLSSDAAIDPSFGVSGVARVGGWGVDRIAMLVDGSIAAAAPGVLYRLEPNGTPAAFPGSELLAVPIGSGYTASAMTTMQDDSVITSAGFSGPMDDWELSHVSISGGVTSNWAWPYLSNHFSAVASFARHRDGTRLMACGSRHDQTLVVQRWQDDGRPDPTFASATGGKVELGVDHRPNFGDWRASRCGTILPESVGGHVVVGDWSKPYEYGGGRILLAHLDASGAIDAAFDGSGRGRELALGAPDQWTTWHVADAATASDGAVLLIARRTSASIPDDMYLPNDLGEQPTVIARVEVSPSGGVGSIGFNDAAVRIAERRHGELRVYRSGGTAGSISVSYELLHDTADAADVVATAGTLTWADGDQSPRTIALVPVDDTTLEGEELFRVRLSEATGGAGLGVPEIEVTIEDDDALRALQFTEPAIRIREAESAEVTLVPGAAVRGPIVVRYAVAPDLDPNDGTPRPTEFTHLHRGKLRVSELRWGGGDTSSRTLRVRTFGDSNVRPDETIYVALADVAGTLRDGNDWKVARITVVDDPVIRTQPPAGGGGGSGGGAISLEVLPFLALALLLNFCGRALAPINRDRCGGRTRESAARRARTRIRARS
jgi:uncharacterized delta-60 repeat protein